LEEKVYAPGENFYQKIELTASKYEVKVGEPLRLFVSRETNGWIKKSRSEIDQAGKCWLKNEPRKHEVDVSFDVSFEVTPPGSHEFDVGMKAVSGRSVMFDSPGEHIIVAKSSLWCPPGTISNQIAILVQY